MLHGVSVAGDSQGGIGGRFDAGTGGVARKLKIFEGLTRGPAPNWANPRRTCSQTDLHGLHDPPRMRAGPGDAVTLCQPNAHAASAVDLGFPEEP